MRFITQSTTEFHTENHRVWTFSA